MLPQQKPKILVVGSFVMDLIVSTPRFPNAGETVLGSNFTTAPGGKGANQAVQAARLGADVTMLGKVGEDDFGRQMIQSIMAAGVSAQHVLQTKEVSSAIGNVQLEVKEHSSQNRIIVVSGANDRIIPEDIHFLKEEIAQYDMVILQLEIPMNINELVAQYAYDKSVPVMLNPAPSASLKASLLSYLTYISPNEHEAADLTGVTVVDEESARKAASILQDRGVENVLITRGEAGAVLASNQRFIVSPCIKSENVVDPTAAGDSFVSAFCTATCLGISPEKALLFANCAGSITVSKMGAQPSLPTLEEVLSLMKNLGHDIKSFNVLRSN
ncbi:MAG: ribokinase [Clostridiales bacterium]|nr:ribokinase [Clostridiales bacterium]